MTKLPPVVKMCCAMIFRLSSNSIKNLYEEAENALKRYERISLSNLAPALNELRYAGHHLLEADSAFDEADRDKHLIRAKAHCERAKFDAKEATIISLLECIADLRTMGISADEMRQFIPEWDTLIDNASAARALLERAGSSKDTRDDTEVESAIECLMTFRDRILAAESGVVSLRNRREEENRRIEEYNLAEKARAEEDANIARERKDDRRFVTSTILSIAGVVLGVFGLVASIYGIILSIKAS